MRNAIVVGVGLLAFAGAMRVWASPVTFRIDSLTSAGAVVRDHNALTGDDRGGIALSSTQVFYTGDNRTAGFDRNSLATGTLSPFRMDGIVGLIGNKQLYALSTNGTTPGGTTPQITHLIALDPSGTPTGTSVPLSAALTVSSFQNGVFAGWDSIFVLLGSASGGTVVEIDPLTGAVAVRGSAAVSARFAESWAFYGVAEHFGGEDYLTYATSSGIQRTRLSDGLTGTVAFGPGVLSDMAAFTVDPFAGRWYFHYEGGSPVFGGTSETIGYANATFTVAAVPEPGTVALIVAALGALAVGRRRRSSR